MSWPRTRMRTLGGVLLVGALATYALASPDPDYKKAEFTYSTDPTRVILYVTSTSATSRSMGISYSMTLYGDGDAGPPIERARAGGGVHAGVAPHRGHAAVASCGGPTAWPSGMETTSRRSGEASSRSEPRRCPEHDLTSRVLLSIEDYERGAYPAKRSPASPSGSTRRPS